MQIKSLLIMPGSFRSEPDQEIASTPDVAASSPAVMACPPAESSPCTTDEKRTHDGANNVTPPADAENCDAPDAEKWDNSHDLGFLVSNESDWEGADDRDQDDSNDGYWDSADDRDREYADDDGQEYADDHDQDDSPSSVEMPVVPEPGNIYSIQDFESGDLLSLYEGSVTLRDAWSALSSQWACIEQSGWMALRNTATGQLLGLGTGLNVECLKQNSRLHGDRNLVYKMRPDGGIVLQTSSGGRLAPFALKTRHDGRRVLTWDGDRQLEPFVCRFIWEASDPHANDAGAANGEAGLDVWDSWRQDDGRNLVQWGGESKRWGEEDVDKSSVSSEDMGF